MSTHKFSDQYVPRGVPAASMRAGGQAPPPALANDPEPHPGLDTSSKKRTSLFHEIQDIEERATAESDGDIQQLNRLGRGIDKIDEQKAWESRDLRRQMDGMAFAGKTVTIESGTGFGTTRTTDPTGPYDTARRNIDGAVRTGELPDTAADTAHVLLERGTDEERSLASRWAAAAGSEDYRSAFVHLLADPTHGHRLWTAREQDAFRRAGLVSAELQRTAMSTTGANGGYMIPLTLDPAILLTSNGSNNPLRQLARVEVTTTNAWQGVTSAGATAEWKSEGSEAADGSPTLAAPSIPICTGDSFVPYSYEVGMDGINFLLELQRVLIDSADNLQATAFTTGSGSGQPQGIVTGLAGTGSEINCITAETLTAADAYALQDALPARFSANATWQSHIAIGNSLRQAETTNGALKFPSLHELPGSLLGKPWFENSNMDGSINTAATANNYVLLYGDVRQAFVIVDRVGSTLELIPNIMGSNQRPTGQRGAMLYFRTGSEVINTAAMRMLVVPTTA